jgi:hypothetical protein
MKTCSSCGYPFLIVWMEREGKPLCGPCYDGEPSHVLPAPLPCAPRGQKELDKRRKM